jgi:hypothetical protein
MTWQSLSDTVARLHAIRPAGGVDDFRVAAATMAATVYGTEALANAPTLVNCAGLALSMARLTRHELTADAIELVHATDLHTLPSEPPRLLRGAWILEARRPERRCLFGDTASLGGYTLDGAVFLLGIGYPDGAVVARWQPHWTGEDLDASVTPDTASPLIDDVALDFPTAWARQAARFAVVLALLLESVSTPLTVEEPPRARREGARHAGTPAPWVVRRVHLRTPAPVQRMQAGEGARPSAGGDRQALAVEVRGHLKRQPYGPGGTLRRWIYVSSYEARRWVAPRPVSIIVDR